MNGKLEHHLLAECVPHHPCFGCHVVMGEVAHDVHVMSHHTPTLYICYCVVLSIIHQGCTSITLEVKVKVHSSVTSEHLSTIVTLV